MEDHPSDTEAYSGVYTRIRRLLRRFAGPLIALFTLTVMLIGLELAAYIWEHDLAQSSLGWTMVASAGRVDASMVAV